MPESTGEIGEISNFECGISNLGINEVRFTRYDYLSTPLLFNRKLSLEKS